MKKYISSYIWLFMLIILICSACQSNEKQHFRIGFSQCGMDDRWREEMVEGMNRELSFYPELSMILKDSKWNNKTQYAQIEELINLPVDLLIVSPNDSKFLEPVITKAYQKGIPVLVVDRHVFSDQFTAFVGANNLVVGQHAGEYANILLNGHGRVLEVGFGPRTAPALGRHNGFHSVIQKYPHIQYVDYMNKDWADKDLREALRQKLKSNPDLTDLIFAHNDRCALIAYDVCKELGIEKKIKFIGVDGLVGNNLGLDLVKKGIINATILYPTGGEESIRVAAKILRKQAFEKENQLFTSVIDAQNVNIMLAQLNKLKEQHADIERQATRIKDLTKIFSSQQAVLYLSFFFLILLLLLGAVLFYLFRDRQDSNVRLSEQNEAILNQKNEIERISLLAKQATEDKLRFYSYISHEFRTPLSLILTPTQDILHRKTLDVKETRQAFLLIQKNANRLLRLVDQLLELRKVDSGKMELNRQQHDLVSFIKDIVNDFQVKAKSQQIDLQFICPFKTLPFSFDAEKLDKVFFNIISNAFKYTPDGGAIHISLLKNVEKLEVLISDNGIGMTQEEKERAFDLFYRGNQNISLGTGLGLALSREFLTLHQGEIEVESQKGKGTTFKIILPILASEDTEGISLMPHYTKEDIEPTVVVDTPAVQHHENTLVLIEDNPDLRLFLKQKLQQFYNVVSVETAEAGWTEILSNIPDLIISDVMLPGMDGFSLTQKIKNDFRSSHIPVILLTAKGQTENQIEGTRAGADAYIPKPFNQQLLEEKIKGLLDNRDRMRRRFSGEITNPSQIQKGERKFLVEFELLLEKHLTESTLSVEKLSRELGMSRVQLFRKISALTNKNVTDYIADFKLLKAKALLKESDKTISEIAYELGFNNPSYFTTFFKQKTNQTPSEWRNS
ncbi:substrate-binding domain-containing protein [Flectobacillus rivi]|uniref:histidine kinase n=1 Tax=Flectobacillus rivi TaxID=2984209 RepID=A0ABT6YXT8_9BACT|nr:substrate-binding domain-containing protein [Flectobacillus rivi]MDI9873643.1 substrate-binding domain-containing protein [Flectobacillus rivi]